MIIVKMMQGLGNQLFQYAVGRNLALKFNTSLKFDISEFSDDSYRKFELHYFNEPAKISCNLEGLLNNEFNLYKEPHFHFDESFKCTEDNTYLMGFWQSEKYFFESKETILSDLTIKKEHINPIEAKAIEIRRTKSVCLHIRRGDYLNPPFNDSFGVLPMEYYYKALNFIKRRIGFFKVYIFSDDIESVRKEISLECDHEFISSYVTKTNIEDFYLMSNCNHHIIANSSFSWWSAWLCTNPNKIVITPDPWFIGKKFIKNDILPGSWIKMSRT